MNKGKNVKFKVAILSQMVLVDAAQLETILEVVSDCETANDEWVGDSKGLNGTNYMPLIKKFSIDKVNLIPIMDDTIETLRLATKLTEEAKTR